MTEADNRFVEEFEQQQAWNFRINVQHGFEPDCEADYNVGEKIALIHAELSEGLEYIRKGDGQSDHIPEFRGIEEELADAVIRIMNLAQRKHYRLAEAMIAKRDFNNARPFKHGGKKF